MKNYGDLLFDVAFSILDNSNLSQQVVHTVFKRLSDEFSKPNRFVKHERARVIQITNEVIAVIHKKSSPKPITPTQVMLDTAMSTEERMKNISEYLRRLSCEDQMIVLLKDKFGLPYPEISAALNIPEGSVKVRRQQTLRALEDWIWNQT